MNRQHINIAKAFTKPSRVKDVAAQMKVTEHMVYLVFKQVRTAGIDIQHIGHAPNIYFYIPPFGVRKLKSSLQDNIIDVLKAGDVWTYQELADLFETESTAIRRAVNTIEKLNLLEINKKKFLDNGVWKNRIQYKYAEEPCF